MADLDTGTVDKEILPFLSVETKPQVRSVAVQYMLGLTGTDDGRTFIGENTKYLKEIILIFADEQPAIAKDAYLALVNLSADASAAWILTTLDVEPLLVVNLLTYVLKEDSEFADIACTILSNLSRCEKCAQRIVDIMAKNDDTIGFAAIISRLCHVGYNPRNSLDYLAPFMSNLTQIRDARRYILDRDRCVVQRLLPFTQYEKSIARRGGIIATLKNCCFEIRYHDWLLSDDVDILSCLLLPLAGPEEYDDDDMSRLPEDLQYLEPDKKREPDVDIRRMLVEAVNQLCATAECRKIIIDKNTYVILRDLHRWEKDVKNGAVIERLIALLIADEPEPGMEDLARLDIPTDVHQKLDAAREQEEQELDKEEKEMKAGEPGEDAREEGGGDSMRETGDLGR